MARKKNMLTAGWERHHIYLIPTIRISDGFTRGRRFSFTFFFLGWQVFFTRYEEWTVEDFKNHIEELKDKGATSQPPAAE